MWTNRQVSSQVEVGLANGFYCLQGSSRGVVAVILVYKGCELGV
jgi:hypothetical protein